MLNTSIHGFHHLPHDRGAFDDPDDERRAFFEKMWASPGFTKLTSNYLDLLTDPSANAAWCDFLAEKVRGIVEDPDVAEQLIPQRPPVRREAARRSSPATSRRSTTRRSRSST